MPPAALPWIVRLVSLDTTSRDSNLPLIELVADELRRQGIEPSIFPTADGQKANLVATIPAADGTRTGGVVLSGHTDVVPVDGQPWSSDPFTPEVRDGRLYGRGTCDMKSFIGVVMDQLPRMVRAPLREPIHLALTYDEEVGCIGGAAIVQQIAKLGLRPRACFVGEPTSMRVIRGHKSISLLEISFHGTAAHSSLTPKGVNAIHHAAELISFVHAMAKQWRDDGPYDDAYRVSYTTTGVNLIKGGIFMYPGTSDRPEGKLRLLYECNPFAFIAEVAGGKATDGKGRILDIVPTKLHQRTPFFVGSIEMMEEMETYVQPKA